MLASRASRPSGSRSEGLARGGVNAAHELVEREIAVEGVPVRYRTGGTGPPVVLVHGLSGSARWWRPVLPALTSRHAVHLVDLPGFGRFRAGGPRFALARACSWLDAWIEAAGLERPTLVGHSMGAAIALRLAGERGERVGRLVLVAPAGLPTGRSLLGHALPLAAALRRSRPRFLALLARDALRAGPRTLAGATRDVLAEDVREELGAVAVPTLVVVGERDTLTPRAAVELVRAGVASSRLVVLAGAGHVPMFDRPEELAEAVLTFLDGRAVGR